MASHKSVGRVESLGEALCSLVTKDALVAGERLSGVVVMVLPMWCHCEGGR